MRPGEPGLQAVVETRTNCALVEIDPCFCAKTLRSALKDNLCCRSEKEPMSVQAPASCFRVFRSRSKAREFISGSHYDPKPKVRSSAMSTSNAQLGQSLQSVAEFSELHRGCLPDTLQANRRPSVRRAPFPLPAQEIMRPIADFVPDDHRYLRPFTRIEGPLPRSHQHGRGSQFNHWRFPECPEAAQGVTPPGSIEQPKPSAFEPMRHFGLSP